MEFSEQGVSILVGTCSAALAPDCVRGVGVRVWPGACRLTVLVPVSTGATTLVNARENPRLAVTLSHMPTHRTIQIKGAVLAVRDGGDDERALAERYRERFAEQLAFVGVGQGPRLGIWPCAAIDVQISTVFNQTPGPAAGIRMQAETTP